MSTAETSQEFHLKVEQNGSSSVSMLSEASQLSHQAVKRAMNKGTVWLTRNHHTQRLRRASRELHKDDELHFYFDPKVLAQTPPEATLIADEGAYSVWSKPCGMWSQGSKWGDHCAITRWAEQHLQPQRSAFLVHRLDRAASGLILLAHKKSAAAALSKLFHDRKISKCYRVVIHGELPNESLTANEPLDDRSACSHIRLIAYDPEQNQSRLEVQIETGRKHQIRRHLAGLGFPVVGDRLYGNTTLDGNAAQTSDLQLTAWSLAFTCPLSGDNKHYELNNSS